MGQAKYSSSFLITFNEYLFIHLFIYVCVLVCMIIGQLVGITSLPPSCGSRDQTQILSDLASSTFYLLSSFAGLSSSSVFLTLHSALAFLERQLKDLENLTESIFKFQLLFLYRYYLEVIVYLFNL